MLKMQIIYNLIVLFFWSIHIANAFIIASNMPAIPITKHEKLTQMAIYTPTKLQNVRHSLQFQGLYCNQSGNPLTSVTQYAP